MRNFGKYNSLKQKIKIGIIQDKKNWFAKLSADNSPRNGYQ
jgi:hypothetical protein